MSDERLVKSYTALEQLWLAKASDEEKVQWFQNRAISAEQANEELRADKETEGILAKFPGVKAAHLAGAKTVAEKEVVATAVKAAIDEAGVAGQSVVEAAVKEALKLKDEEIVEMRKVYGKARQPQAGDVTGSGIAQTAAAASQGVGTTPETIENGSPNAVNRAVAAAAEPLLKAFGFK